MKNCCALLLTILFSLVSYSQNIPNTIHTKDFTIGKTVTIHSKLLDENRELNIYIPNSYKQDSLKTYPVIYLLDGSKDEDFIHIVGLVQFGSFSWINLVPESIVVGISNVDRKRDFTYPSKNNLDQKEFPTSGHSHHFINFIEKELKPYINNNYRTNSTNTIIGQSLGGLLATEILFKKTDLFTNYIIVSPSLWWDNENLLTYNLSTLNNCKHVYIAVGKEGEVMERTAKQLHKKLENLSSNNTNLHFNFLEDKTHGDALHIAVYNAFSVIFK